MNADTLRQRMESLRRAAEGEAKSMKDTYIVLDRVTTFYQALTPQERVLADEVLARWALSNDEATRFDALTLIHDFRIKTARNALEVLATRLAADRAPGAPFELQKVQRLLQTLDATP